LLLKEDAALSSPLAVLYYEYYQTVEDLNARLTSIQDNIQCIVTQAPLQMESSMVTFGQSQHPALWDYADNVNTIEFLNNLIV